MPSAHIKGLVIAQSAIARSAYAFRIILEIGSGAQPIGERPSELCKPQARWLRSKACSLREVHQE